MTPAVEKKGEVGDKGGNLETGKPETGNWKLGKLGTVSHFGDK